MCSNGRKTARLSSKAAAAGHVSNRALEYRKPLLRGHNSVKAAIPRVSSATVLEPTPKRRASEGNEFKSLRSALRGSLALKASWQGREGRRGKKHGEPFQLILFLRRGLSPLPTKALLGWGLQKRRREGSPGRTNSQPVFCPIPSPDQAPCQSDALTVCVPFSWWLLLLSQRDFAPFYIHTENHGTLITGVHRNIRLGMHHFT